MCVFMVTGFTACIQGGDTIRQLLKVAKKTIPKEDWWQTPVLLKATAGLRLMPQEKAQGLLEQVLKRSYLCFLHQCSL